MAEELGRNSKKTDGREIYSPSIIIIINILLSYTRYFAFFLVYPFKPI